MSLISYTFFKKRPKVGEYKLWPLTGGRLILLEEKGNPLAGDDGADGDPDAFALYEALLVCISDGEELAEMSMLPATDWALEVRKFGFDCPDDALNDFQSVIEQEMLAIRKAQVQPVKKRVARKAARRSVQGKR